MKEWTRITLNALIMGLTTFFSGLAVNGYPPSPEIIYMGLISFSVIFLSQIKALTKKPETVDRVIKKAQEPPKPPIKRIGMII